MIVGIFVTRLTFSFSLLKVHSPPGTYLATGVLRGTGWSSAVLANSRLLEGGDREEGGGRGSGSQHVTLFPRKQTCDSTVLRESIDRGPRVPAWLADRARYKRYQFWETT